MFNLTHRWDPNKSWNAIKYKQTKVNHLFSLSRTVCFVLRHINLIGHLINQVKENTKVVQNVSRLFSSGHFYWEYTHETHEIFSSSCNALVLLFQQLLEGPMEVLLCERVNDLCHSLFHLLNCLITTASKVFIELRE